MRVLFGLALAITACRTPSNDSGTSSPTVPTTATPAPTTPTVAPTDFTVTRPKNDTCQALPRPVPASSVTFEPAFGDFWVEEDTILDLAQAPGDDDHWYLGTRNGRVLRVSESVGATSEVEVLDLTGEIVQHLEGGLLGLAFSPDFQANGVMYISYTVADAARVSRFVTSDGGASFGSETVVLEQAMGYGFHIGGDLHVDGHGRLLYSVGDHGNFFNATDLQHLGGSIVRIDPEGDDNLPPVGALRIRNYAIPADNPAIPGALPEIFAYGLRNPFRMTVDPLTQDVWAGDVGEDAWEEANLIVPGGHHGWPIKEGPDCFVEEDCDDTGLVEPIAVYGRDEGVSIIGGHVYRGASIPSLQGVYVFNEWLSGDTWGAFIDPATGEPVRSYLGTIPSGRLAWGQSHDGELYSAGFTVYRVDPGGTPEVPFPQRLSETGCASPDNVREPAAGLIPYTVRVPLWSDDAGKRRWMALPNDARIERTEDGRWDLPVGTVLVKEFTADEVRVETRLMMRHDDGGWGFYTYRWDDDGADATLVVAGSTVDTGSRTWAIPSRSQCLQCHTDAAGVSLGLTDAQLNHDADLWGVGAANQVEVFRRMGLMAEDPGEPSSLPAHPALEDDAPVRDRARAYLDVQCASCHQPDSTAPTDLDLRWTTARSAMQACDEVPADGDLGLSDARIVAPGAPERSVLLERMRRLDGSRMPRVGSERVDPVGVGLVDDWIAEMVDCQP